MNKQNPSGGVLSGLVQALSTPAGGRAFRRGMFKARLEQIKKAGAEGNAQRRLEKAAAKRARAAR